MTSSPQQESKTDDNTPTAYTAVTNNGISSVETSLAQMTTDNSQTSVNVQFIEDAAVTAAESEIDAFATDNMNMDVDVDSAEGIDPMLEQQMYEYYNNYDESNMSSNMSNVGKMGMLGKINQQSDDTKYFYNIY